MTDIPRDQQPITRKELHDALRFLHSMFAQGQLELARVDAILSALVAAMLDAGRLDVARMDTLIAEASAKMSEKGFERDATVDIGPSIDKYTVASPDVDCASLLPLCKGRCCRLVFALSFQDLDEGRVAWDYRRPYKIRQGPDGTCVHAGADHRCGVYEARPATCRTYDCRNDPRIWTDFANRVPAPMEKVAPLVQLKTRPRMDKAKDKDSAP